MRESFCVGVVLLLLGLTEAGLVLLADPLQGGDPCGSVSSVAGLSDFLSGKTCCLSVPLDLAAVGDSDVVCISLGAVGRIAGRRFGVEILQGFNLIIHLIEPAGVNVMFFSEPASCLLSGV